MAVDIFLTGKITFMKGTPDKFSKNKQNYFIILTRDKVNKIDDGGTNLFLEGVPDTEKIEQNDYILILGASIHSSKDKLNTVTPKIRFNPFKVFISKTPFPTKLNMVYFSGYVSSNTIIQGSQYLLANYSRKIKDAESIVTEFNIIIPEIFENNTKPTIFSAKNRIIGFGKLIGKTKNVENKAIRNGIIVADFAELIP